MSASHPPAPEFVRAMGPVARELLGEPTEHNKAKRELRYGTRGSLSISEEKGTWHDHEADRGGGVVDFVQEYGPAPDKKAAVAWLRERGHLAPAEAAKAARPRQVDAYDYHDEAGAPLFQVRRMEPKNFIQAAADGRGGWVCRKGCMDGVRLVPYRLPQLIEAVAQGRTIYITEGEKGVHALEALGVVGTCSPGGAGKWRPAYNPHFAGATVVVLSDNDPQKLHPKTDAPMFHPDGRPVLPGQDHAADVAQHLAGIAARVRVLMLPDLPLKGDVADWIAAGGTRDALEALAAASPVARAEVARDLPPPQRDELPEKPKWERKKAFQGIPDGDLILNPGAPLNSARQFIRLNHMHHELRTLHHQHGTFYTWQGSHYVDNSPEEMRARLYAFLDTAKRLTDEDEIRNFDPTKAKVANVLEATAAAAQLPTAIQPPAWLDDNNAHAATDIMACTNGLVHLPTRSIQAHTPAFFTTNALDFAYDPEAPEPTNWLNFLTQIWPADPDAIRTLQEIFGLCLTGDTKHQKAFLIVGPKRSGKGTIARVLTRMLGAANVCGPTLSGLSTNFGIAPLIGKRLAIISDARLSGKADQQVIVERLLAITGEDSVTVDRKFLTGWTGQLGVRFLILTNELPRLSDASGALAGRFITLTMTHSFFGKEDLGLTQRLLPELPGILKWSLAGLDRLKDRGHFVPPASSARAQQELEDLGSPIGAFLRDCCDVGPGKSIPADTLYRAWCEWCREQGRDHPGTVQTFGRDLGAAVPGLALTRPRTEDGRQRTYEGIALSEPPVVRDGPRSTALQSHSDYYTDDPGY